jgi:hypothetical protein
VLPVPVLLVQPQNAPAKTTADRITAAILRERLFILGPPQFDLYNYTGDILFNMGATHTIKICLQTLILLMFTKNSNLQIQKNKTFLF